MNINLVFFNFKDHKPSKDKDCFSFILKFKRDYYIASWGAERQMFFDESGDYIEDTEFLWAELP